MSEEQVQLVTPGTLYVASEVLQLEQWMIDQVISAARLEMRKFVPDDGYLRPTGVRRGDFVLLISSKKIAAYSVSFIGIPGRQRSAIVQEMYTTV